MFTPAHVILSLLAFWRPLSAPPEPSESKSVAIIGGGSAGLAMLKTLLDTPQARNDWRITLFEQRRSVGGIWLPDPIPIGPRLPQTPLYPQLHTNTPVPSMTYPNFPFPPGTPLYPSHEHIEDYHVRYAEVFHLATHIRLQHEVLSTSWIGTPEEGTWNVTFRDGDQGVHTEFYDHLIVASGNNHFPHIPVWRGQEEWLASSPRDGPAREIVHSIWYRGPEKYKNKRVIVVGSGASGSDISTQIAPLVSELYVSTRSASAVYVSGAGAIQKPEIGHFTSESIVFVDGSTAEVDVILLATGYDLHKPFLEEGGVIVTNTSASSNESYVNGLTTNLRYIFPLHQHIFSLSHQHPTTALAFIGLPKLIANCPSDIAQSIFVTQALLNSSLLPTRETLLQQLNQAERTLKRAGYDPYYVGHALANGSAPDYQDALIAWLKLQGALPNDGKPFVEPWRREWLTFQHLKQGWKHIEELGQGSQWVAGIETEDQWADLMRRVNAWEEGWETTAADI